MSVQGLPENYAPLLAENIRKGAFTHVFAGHSAFGKNLMPRVSALLDVQQISDITAIENENSGRPANMSTSGDSCANCYSLCPANIRWQRHPYRPVVG